MKFNIKMLLAGVILPVGAMTIFNSNSLENKTVSSPTPKPYIIDVISPEGDQINELKGTSLSQDPYLIAQDLKADPYKEDKFTAFPDLKMGIGSKITLYRAPTFQLIDGRKTSIVRSWAKTVGDLLIEVKVPELGLDDRINFALDTELENKMEITIVRVAVTTVLEKQPIDFTITKKEDKSLDEGKTRIDRAGVNGEKTYYYLVRREDGVEVSRNLTKTEISKEPVSQILIIGTKPVITVPCKFNSTVLAAAIKYGIKPNDLCYRMMRESNGNPNSDGGAYKGLFQYEEGLWSSVSAKAGYSGASIWDATAQIYTTAWAWSHGYRSRWPIP
jgi:uncharacterized protein YabE (DUF348 family)